MPHHLIVAQKDVDEFCRRLAGADAIGVDTEFLRVRTYYPRLALVQISTRDAIYCLDPLAKGIRLDGLWTALQNERVLKVMHAARQDVEVLLHAADVAPRRLFDTQVAARLAGYPEQVGYAGLVEAEFGEILPKTVQRTDWTRRPLTDAQLGYACNDVRYLLPLRECLETRLASLGRLDWAREDFEQVLDPALYQADPEQAYRRVGRGARLRPVAQQHLKRLCAWRERTAQERDKPRNWILDDETVASIAAAAPRSPGELGRIDGIKPEMVRRDGSNILACIVPSDRGAGEALWSRRDSLSDAQKALKATLIEALEKRATELGIAESVLATRSDLDRLVRGAPPAGIFPGWRWQAVGCVLADVLSASPAGGEAPDQRAS